MAIEVRRLPKCRREVEDHLVAHHRLVGEIGVSGRSDDETSACTLDLCGRCVPLNIEHGDIVAAREEPLDQMHPVGPIAPVTDTCMTIAPLKPGSCHRPEMKIA